MGHPPLVCSTPPTSSTQENAKQPPHFTPNDIANYEQPYFCTPNVPPDPQHAAFVTTSHFVPNVVPNPEPSHYEPAVHPHAQPSQPPSHSYLQPTMPDYYTPSTTPNITPPPPGKTEWDLDLSDVPEDMLELFAAAAALDDGGETLRLHFRNWIEAARLANRR